MPIFESRISPSSESFRANRAAHLAYIQETGVVEQAGPFIDAAGQMCGSLLVLGLGSKAEAEVWAASDPYAKAGLFQSVMIQEWKRVIG